MTTLLDVQKEVETFLSQGKGMERHGGVEEGDWREIVEHHGPGFLTGQAHKKLIEGMRMRDPDRRRREILGVIGYLYLYLIHEGGDRI